MKRCQFCGIILFLMLVSIIFCCSGNSGNVDIMDLIPEKGETGDWNPVDKPQKYVGEDLWEFINGGAEVYHEFGFRQAAAQEFKNYGDKSINLEIYEMNNPASAFGVYTFKTSAKGIKLDIGNDAVQEDYYMNFWKNNFVVTLIGFDTDGETIGGLTTIAKAIASKIKTKAEKPDLVKLLPSDNLREIKYFLGYTALFNYYEFGTKDIFGMKEGTAGDYGDFKIFIFRYENESECKKWHENTKESLNISSGFSAFLNIGDAFSVTDNKGVQIYCRPYNQYILTIMGKGQNEAEEILSELDF